MNFYNPYIYTIPGSQNVGLLGRLFGKTGVSISNFLNGTQKVLNIANQTIPLVKQVKPVIGNAKTMFKIMNEFKKTDTNNNINIINTSVSNNQNKAINKSIEKNITFENDGPVFFQ